MITILLWTEFNGVASNEIKIDCDTFDDSEEKTCYRSSRTTKGRARQDWYSKYNKFSLSFSNMVEEDKIKLDNIINDKISEIFVLYNHSIYPVIIAGQTRILTPKFSPTLKCNIYSGKLDLEEIFADEDILESYIPVPFENIGTDSSTDNIIPTGYICGGQSLLSSSPYPTTSITEVDFSLGGLMYESYESLATIDQKIQGGNSSSSGYVRNQRIDFLGGIYELESELSSNHMEGAAATNSDTDVFYYGGIYIDREVYPNDIVYKSTISKRDFTLDVAESLTETLTTGDRAYAIGFGNSSFGIIAGGVPILGGARGRAIEIMEYSTETISESVETISVSRISASITSSDAGYFVGGKDWFNNIYIKNSDRYDYTTETISTISAEMTYEFMSIDGVNNDDFGIIVKQGERLGENIGINTTEKLLFNTEVWITTGQNWAIPTNNHSSFQSGGFY